MLILYSLLFWLKLLYLICDSNLKDMGRTDITKSYSLEGTIEEAKKISAFLRKSGIQDRRGWKVEMGIDSGDAALIPLTKEGLPNPTSLGRNDTLSRIFRRLHEPSYYAILLLRRPLEVRELEYLTAEECFLRLKEYITVGAFVPGHKLFIDMKDPQYENFLSIIKRSIKNELGYATRKTLQPSPLSHLKEIREIEGSAYFPTYPFADLGEDGLFDYSPFCYPQYSLQDVLYHTRKSKPFKAFDERAMEILNTLIDSLPKGRELLFTFALYKIYTNFFSEEDEYMNEHQEVKLGIKKFIHMKGKDISQERLEEICKQLPPSWALGIKSTIVHKGKRYHIPMIDFTESYQIDNLTIEQDYVHIITELRNDSIRYKRYNKIQVLEPGTDLLALHESLRYADLEMDGMIVESGNSLHFYGLRLLTPAQWRKFMILCSDFHFVDRGFFDIQFRSRSTLLRLTPSLEKLTQPSLYGTSHNGLLYPEINS